MVKCDIDVGVDPMGPWPTFLFRVKEADSEFTA